MNHKVGHLKVPLQIFLISHDIAKFIAKSLLGDEESKEQSPSVGSAGKKLMAFEFKTTLFFILPRRPRPQGSPLTTLFRVFAASASKILHRLPRDPNDLYEIEKCDRRFHTRGLRCLDKAAIILPTPNREQQEQNRWKLCRVTEVEETKITIRMIPMWMTFIMCGVVSSIGNTYSLEQANHMDRKVGHLKKSPPPLLILLLTNIHTEAQVPNTLRGILTFAFFSEKEEVRWTMVSFVRISASASKIFYQCPTDFNELYERHDPDLHLHLVPHTRGLRCLDKAAIISQTQTHQKGNRWKLCSVTEVEETKITIRMIPMWMAFIICGVVSSIGNTYFLEQANHMNRKREEVPGVDNGIHCQNHGKQGVIKSTPEWDLSEFSIHLRLPIDPHRLYERHDLGDDLVPHTNGFRSHLILFSFIPTIPQDFDELKFLYLYKDSPVEEEEVPVEEPREDRMQPRFVVERYREVLSESYNNDDFEEVRYREVLSESYHND
ncbi:hypothetical protein L1049_007859 [Liquidambar formosana]|uniref:Uncharacterized protein n=1 Tax=Liquidambar formosana TaxID=63359 RepID=A0AAP0S8T1_LIQFO